MTAVPEDRGATLLELTAVMAVFSLLSVMSLQLLAGALDNRTRIVGAGDRAEELAAVSAVFRRDIEHSAPVADVGGQDARFRVEDGGRTLRFSILSDDGGEARQSPSLRIVTWQFDVVTGTLSRSTDAALDEGRAQTAAMLDRLEGWSVRVRTAEDGWLPPGNWRAPEPWELPLAVEITFGARPLGEIRVLAAR
ncbi:type II secretion system protein GspJ [Sulfitobacter sp. D35]|uniref:type II secretion system protein GspJ n=1 Tax=Sulfitobacter sp. D35 TaxID=3083252 RepID=UPI00296F83BE|nr:type II secretion system protein GspJ [Sulfitobacter sp. D35]MDW4500487.1 type II secretion system protein GspJ [Sulfitobacter sp. D35]